MSLYRNILKQAAQIAWRNKYLWFFGLFASLIGSGVGYETLINGLSYEGLFPNLRRIAATGVFHQSVFSSLSKIIAEEPSSLLLIILILFLLAALTCYIIWLAIVSQAALVDSAAGNISGKNFEKNIKEGMGRGMKNFWPVFWLNAISKIAILIIMYIISLPLLMQNKIIDETINYLYAANFLVFISIAITATFIIKYAIAFVVIKENSVIEALQQGWRLFARNWLISIEMAFILFFINIAVGLVLSLAILAAAVPFAILAFISLKFISIIAFWLIAALAFILILALTAVIGSVLAVFQITSWTGLFIELAGKGAISKLVRIFSRA